MDSSTRIDIAKIAIEKKGLLKKAIRVTLLKGGGIQILKHESGQRPCIQHLSKIVSRFTRTERSSETPNKWTCMSVPLIHWK